MKSKYPELLLPAGGIKQFIAAAENGADAIYVGGRSFNARIHADNFDNDELSRAIDYAHKRAVKVYVTMNTLIRDEEMFDALQYACELYEMGADALIIQDLGLGSMIRKTIPKMPLHLSTQACCCDSESVRLAAELGYERVVLARELNIDEIRDACENTPAEIEVFVHGALCVCYSGECQLSRYYGGRSGNRGSCAQPCRLPWRRADSPHGKYYQLSPKDICLIDMLGELIDAGVCSFKVEGRMKSPEYVAQVASIYRKYIDSYIETGTYSVSHSDRTALLQIFNRGGFSAGYIHGNPGESLMSGDIPKNQGLRVGTLVGARRGTTLVDVKLDKASELELGDGVEIYGKNETAGNIISYCKQLESGVLRIGDIRHRNLNPGAAVYKTSSRKQLEEIRRTYEGADINDGEGRKCRRRRGISLVLEENNSQLSLSACAGDVQVRKSAGPFDKSVDRPASKERYITALSKSGGTPFEIKEIVIPEELSLSVKASELNALRRDTLEALENALIFRREPALPDKNLRLIKTNDMTPVNLEARRIALAELCLMSDEEIRSIDKDKCEVFISAVSRGKEDEILLSNYERCLELAREFGVYVGNLGWLHRLKLEGITFTADSGLNSMNAYTAELFRELGAAGVVESPELADPSAFERQRLSLMVSEHDWSKGTNETIFLKCADSKELRIERREFSSQSYIMLK